MTHIDLDGLSACHRALAEPLRLAILRLVMEREVCVCEIVAALGEPQYKVSRHLGVLRRAGLVRFRRLGTWKLYRLETSPGAAVAGVLAPLRDLLDTVPEIRRALGRFDRRGPITPAAGAACAPAVPPPSSRRKEPKG
jgi:DNA-binding transcriptional ArsR family regulator